MSAGRVFVCVTCNRYAPPAAGEATPGQRLALALKQHAAGRGGTVAVRTVECLNGCPNPCTAALRSPGKAVIRFSALTAEDAPALLDAAQLYADSADGDLRDDAVPPPLRAKISDRVSARAV
jgi:predicted metal-binding protein